MVEQNVDLNLFFPTPVWTSIIKNYETLNQDMYNYIQLLKSNNTRGNQKSNIKGWHSDDFDLQNPTIGNFVNHISFNLNKTFNDMNWDLKNQKIKIINMWTIINKKEALNGRHIHGNSFISAAYYLRAPKNCGNIVFYDPRSAPSFSHPKSNTPNNLNATSHSIEPKEGLLVLFPSYLHHSVEPNMSNEERVVISFNINLK